MLRMIVIVLMLAQLPAPVGQNIHPAQPLVFEMRPSEVVPEDAHIRWPAFVPMDALAKESDAFPRIDWIGLRNPVLASPYGAIKNQAVIYAEGWFWIFPQLQIAQGKVCLRTRDFKTYGYYLPKQTIGHAPRLLEHGGRWHALYQLFAKTAERRIFHASSGDLREWTASIEAWPECQPGTRHIDAALAWESGHFYAGFKSVQQFYVTRSRSEVLGANWEDPIKAESEGWCEAYQFIKIDGRWRMVATARAPKGFKTGGNSYTGSHEPFLYTMEGDGSRLEHWAHWKNKTHIALPFTDWNQVMHANTGYLCDWRRYDGWFYLFFAGANDDKTNQGRGHGKIGMARSRDLMKWYLPGESE